MCYESYKWPLLGVECDKRFEWKKVDLGRVCVTLYLWHIHPIVSDRASPCRHQHTVLECRWQALQRLCTHKVQFPVNSIWKKFSLPNIYHTYNVTNPIPQGSDYCQLEKHATPKNVLDLQRILFLQKLELGIELGRGFNKKQTCILWKGTVWACVKF